ncbi:SLBB domain-containing protein [Pseudomonadota bacterium]
MCYAVFRQAWLPFFCLVGFVLAYDVDAQTGSNEYLISPGDVISVQVFDEPSLSLISGRVEQDGMISYPLLGAIEIQGLSSKQVEEKMTRLLKDGYLTRPQVIVTVLNYQPLYVRGAVTSPGAITYTPGMTFLKAIVLAGGYKENADRENVEIIRQGQQQGDAINVETETFVRPGDIISIPELPQKESVVDSEKVAVEGLFIYLQGEIRSPGSYPFRRDLTVEKAVALAGGFGRRASKRKITITRDGDPPEVLKKISLQEPIQAGDVISVGASLF